MFQHRVMLIIFLGAWTHGWIGFMMCSELPNYLTDLGLDLESAGYLSTIPFIGVFCGNIAFGRMFKYLEDEKGWTVTEVRRMSLIIGQGVSSICLIIAGFLSSVPLAFFFTVLCLTFYGASNSCLGCCYLDVAPRFSAQFNAVGNTFSALGGIASPLFVAQILGMFPGNPDDAIHTCDGGDCDDDIAPGKWGWTVVFLFTAAQGWTTIILWSLVYKPDVIPELNTPRAEQKSTAMDDENLKARLI